MGTKHERLLRRIKALEQMYRSSAEEKAIYHNMVWDLICDIILCPVGVAPETLTEYQKSGLLYMLATGEKYTEETDDEN